MSFLKLPHVYLNLPNPTLRLCMISPPTLRSQFSIFFLLYRLLATVDFPSLPSEKSYDPPQNCFHPSPPLLSSPQAMKNDWSFTVPWLTCCPFTFLLETKSISVWMWSTQTILQTWWRMANYNYPYRLSLPTMILPNSPTLSVLLRNLIRRWSHSR